MSEGVRIQIPEWDDFVEEPVTETNQLLLLTAIGMLTEFTGYNEEAIWHLIVGISAEAVAKINGEQ